MSLEDVGVLEKRRVASEQALCIAERRGCEYVMLGDDVPLSCPYAGSGFTLYILNFYNQK